MPRNRRAKQDARDLKGQTGMRYAPARRATAGAPYCSWKSGCRNPTWNSSGLCHVHQGRVSAGTASDKPTPSPIPPETTPDPRSASGEKTWIVTPLEEMDLSPEYREQVIDIVAEILEGYAEGRGSTPGEYLESPLPVEQMTRADIPFRYVARARVQDTCRDTCQRTTSAPGCLWPRWMCYEGCQSASWAGSAPRQRSGATRTPMRSSWRMR